MPNSGRALLGLAATAALVAPPATADAAATQTVALHSSMVVRAVDAPGGGTGTLRDAALGRGTVAYREDRSTGGYDRFRVYFTNGWFDVALDLTDAPTVKVGTGRITRGAGRYAGVTGTITRFDATKRGDWLIVKLQGTLAVAR